LVDSVESMMMHGLANPKWEILSGHSLVGSVQDPSM